MLTTWKSLKRKWYKTKHHLQETSWKNCKENKLLRWNNCSVILWGVPSKTTRELCLERFTTKVNKRRKLKEGKWSEKVFHGASSELSSILPPGYTDEKKQDKRKKQGGGIIRNQAIVATPRGERKRNRSEEGVWLLELFLGNPSTGEVRMPDTRILTRTCSKAEEKVVEHRI